MFSFSLLEQIEKLLRRNGFDFLDFKFNYIELEKSSELIFVDFSLKSFCVDISREIDYRGFSTRIKLFLFSTKIKRNQYLSVFEWKWIFLNIFIIIEYSTIFTEFKYRDLPRFQLTSRYLRDFWLNMRFIGFKPKLRFILFCPTLIILYIFVNFLIKLDFFGFDLKSYKNQYSPNFSLTEISFLSI